MRNENLSPQKRMFKAVLLKIALLEATQMPINKRMDKQTEIYSFNGILLSNKQNNQYTQQNTMPSEGSQARKSTYYKFD